MLKKVSYSDVWKFSWHYWRRHKSLLALIIPGMVMAALVDTLFPIFIGLVIDAITQAGTDKSQLWENVLPYFFIFTIIGFSYHSLHNGTLYLWTILAVRVLHDIENEAFQKVQRFSSDWHANAFAGATVRKITRGKWAFDIYGDILFINLFPSLIVLCAVITYMMFKAPLLGVVTLLSGVVYLAVNIYMTTQINAPLFELSAKRDTKIGAHMADTITANPVVKSFSAERREEKAFKRTLKSWRLRTFKSWMAFITTDLLRRYMAEVMAVCMIGTSIYLWYIDQASPGDVVFTFTSFMLLSNYLRMLGDQMANLQKAVNDMEDIISFWLREDDMHDCVSAKELIVTSGEVVFDHVTFTYKGKTEPLFHDLSLRIKPGERVALVGHSGSGKSTYVKLLQRLYDIDSGKILIDGQNTADVTQESLRRNIAIVQQDPILFHRSIAANIAYAKPQASMQEIVNAARLAFAHDFIEALLDGYRTLVGERGVKLSGGERQRVAIARAVLADAPILILDEATASLDSVSEYYIQKAIDNLVKGKTTITVAHRLATIRNVDRILVFDKGSIVEEGSHKQLIKDSKIYKELYEMQMLEA